MELFTFHTPSHREMCQRFVIDNADLAGFDKCTVFESKQMCETGKYNSAGFAETCWLKLDALATIPTGTDMCYVDADCLILPGLADWCRQWLNDNPHSIGHGNDAGQLCMGSIVLTQTDETIKWWQWLRRLAWMIDMHDQTALNEIIQNVKRVPVGLQYLPNTVFANWATGGELSQKVWQGEELIIPRATLCWHANFCRGIDEKMRMLEMVAAWYRRKCLTFRRQLLHLTNDTREYPQEIR